MILKRENTEINTTYPNDYHAEGTSDEKPEEFDVLMHVLDCGYATSNIEIWFDNFQGFWRWYADIDSADAR